jgi:hypothetical protein
MLRASVTPEARGGRHRRFGLQVLTISRDGRDREPAPIQLIPGGAVFLDEGRFH